ncbi:MAG: hypothetical protein WBW84_19915, partial [Acidobacteriaceae bacterium]
CAALEIAARFPLSHPPGGERLKIETGHFICYQNRTFPLANNSSLAASCRGAVFFTVYRTNCFCGGRGRYASAFPKKLRGALGRYFEAGVQSNPVLTGGRLERLLLAVG